MLAAAFTPPHDDSAASLGVDSNTIADKSFNAARSTLCGRVFDVPRVAAICGASWSLRPEGNTITDTYPALDGAPRFAGGHEANTGPAGDMLNGAYPQPQDAAEYAGGRSEVESGSNESGAPARPRSSTSVMASDSYSLPTSSTPLILNPRAQVQRDVWWDPRTLAQMPVGEVLGVQTPAPSPTASCSTQQASALTSNSPLASAPRFDYDGESPAPAAPKKEFDFSAASPAAIRRHLGLPSVSERNGDRNAPVRYLVHGTETVDLACYRVPRPAQEPGSAFSKLMDSLEAFLAESPSAEPAGTALGSSVGTAKPSTARRSAIGTRTGRPAPRALVNVASDQDELDEFGL
ncbi:hypothetical protein AURDEDRAFT_169581 [Auricularia subglabra TFB-10046 SS5]|uniref:Uncharacterized protein n=1 Tax=Auricularia subglabra (strain TFB-10046 / SS5) TaxID=717982 RepID=J0WYU3_AURST|nr:hypothetical protein AURDEDRAFT_169581 [Auricularia subglabra TFB-10046 SS5]